MMNGMKHRIFRKGFFRDLLILVIPIMVQNFITSSVQLADTVMLGRLSQTALSASSLAGQTGFILYVIHFGLASALTILASQYWGKKDTDTVGKVFGMALFLSGVISVIVTALCFFFPREVLHFWTFEPELLDEGARYLRIVSLSYLALAFSQPYLAIMRSCERVRLSTRVSSFSLILNVILNALLIFGLAGFPKLGIIGAALATLISRIAELVICLADLQRQKIITKDVRKWFDVPQSLQNDFRVYCMPAVVNDVLWVFAYNMNSVIMGHLGSDMVAASSVAGVARELVAVAGYGISSAAAILLGKEIGEGNNELAKQDADAILITAFGISALQGVILFASIPLIAKAAILTENAQNCLVYMLKVSSFYQIFQVLNTTLIASIFRCGGDSRYGMRLDLITMWVITVPISLFSAFVLKLPPLAIYTILCIDEISKFPLAMRHYFSGSWNRNLTRSSF